MVLLECEMTDSIIIHPVFSKSAAPPQVINFRGFASRARVRKTEGISALKRPKVSNPNIVQNCTFLRFRPCEMLSAVRKAETRWVMEPASPQCGRN